MMVSLDASMRGILKGFEIDYIKKARGKIRGECNVSPPTGGTKRVYDVPVVSMRAAKKWRKRLPNG